MKTLTVEVSLITTKNALARFRRAAEKILLDVLADPSYELELFGKEWLTNEKAMEYLGCSRSTLARYRRDGRLRYSKVGNGVYYRRTDIESMLSAGLIDPETPIARVTSRTRTYL